MMFEPGFECLGVHGVVNRLGRDDASRRPKTNVIAL
jgi:hypothetical protein